MSCCVDLRHRGLELGPELAIGDGNLGFWKALRQVYGAARAQRCWVHKTANVLNKLPKGLQAKAKQQLHAIWMAETRQAAEAAFDAFVDAYAAKYDKAVACLVKDRQELLTFYDFPAEHWKHVRTTNPVESTFATVRLRTTKTKGCLSRRSALTMVFRLCQSAERRWRRTRRARSARRSGPWRPLRRRRTTHPGRRLMPCRPQHLTIARFDARNDTVYPDIAFKLPAPAAPRQQRTDGQLVVGVGVMTYFGWRNDSSRGAAIYATYLEKITDFTLWLLDRGHAVRILMGDTNDYRAVNDLLANVAIARPDLPDDRLVFERMSSLHDLMRQIADIDVVVATRYHNIVCALRLGKPIVSLGYAEKNDVLMAEMGVGRFCQHVERFDLDLLIEQFTQLVAERQSYADGIRRANLACQERLEHQDSILLSRLLK